MQLIRLESASDRYTGGIRCTFPSGKVKDATWRSREPIADTLAMGKKLAASVLQSLLDTGGFDDADRTNWVSAAAACQAIVREWNEKTFGDRGLQVAGDDSSGGGMAGEGPLQ